MGMHSFRYRSWPENFFCQDAKGNLDAVNRPGDFPVIAIVSLGEPQIAGGDLGDRDVALEHRLTGRTASGEPFTDQPVVFKLRGFCSVPAEIMVPAGDGDDSLSGCLVLAKFRRGVGEFQHWCNLSFLSAKTVVTVLRLEKQAALPTAGR